MSTKISNANAYRQDEGFDLDISSSSTISLDDDPRLCLPFTSEEILFVFSTS